MRAHALASEALVAHLGNVKPVADSLRRRRRAVRNSNDFNTLDALQPWNVLQAGVFPSPYYADP